MNKKSVLLMGAMVMLVIVGAIIIISINSKSKPTKEEDQTIQIVTTFYPVHMIGLNLTDQIEGVEVNSLTDINTGCLHDYQLTTEDMKAISNADVLITNGGGMEAFLDDMKANYPELTIINSTQDIPMLKYEENSGEEVFDIGQLSGLEELETGEYNSHVWLNPTLYRKQIENVRDGLIEYISTTDLDATIDVDKLILSIEQNAQKYLSVIEEFDKVLQAEVDSLKVSVTNLEKEAQAVIFHDAFSYLADRVGIRVAFTVPLDSDTALSAGDIAMIIDAVKQGNIKYLFTEQQFSDSIAKQIEAETDAKVYIIDSVVTGDGSKESYIKAMQKNLEVIKEAFN